MTDSLITSDERSSRLIYVLLVSQKIILVVSSIFIVFAFGAVVALRYIFDLDLFAYEELVLVAAFLLYFFGGAQGSLEGSHIKAGLVVDLISDPRWRKRYSIFLVALEIVITMFLSYWACMMVLDDIARFPDWPTTIVYNIPLAVQRGAIFIGFALMLLYAMVRFLRLARSENGNLLARRRRGNH